MWSNCEVATGCNLEPRSLSAETLDSGALGSVHAGQNAPVHGTHAVHIATCASAARLCKSGVQPHRPLLQMFHSHATL